LSGFPLWSSDSRSVTYQQGSQIHAAALTAAGDSLRVASRRILKENVRGTLMDRHPAGRRLLMMEPESAIDTARARVPRRVVVVTNWTSVLKERLGRSP
jgi:hypothetical protein